MTSTNSLEAFNANYDRGFRFFEINFSWTSDAELVAIHDWKGALQANFMEPDSSVVVLKKMNSWNCE